MSVARSRTDEAALEAEIEAALIAGGYVGLSAAGFDAERALFPAALADFLKASQPEKWARLAEQYGAGVEARVIANVARAADRHGMLHVLRHGVDDRGVHLDLAFFKPASGLNPEAARLYGLNRLGVARQVRHSPRDPSLSIDLVLAVNGLPVATAELKNPFTGQTVRDAVRQYKEDRDPRDPLLAFKTRALVHFAVDPDLVFMTTRLEGRATRFLPFNRGRAGGAGNPDNRDGCRTDYLWREVWAKDRWLDVLARFVHLQTTSRTGPDGRTTTSEALVFPRYHQLDAVTRLIADARAHGAGRNYLIQHSAGSGKSNSIGWLAHRLAGLHGDDDKPVFDGVVVLTDRRVLDKQLQDTIYQFEHAAGVVERITGERAAKGRELAAALDAGRRIVVVTLHSFAFVDEVVERLRGRRFAVIVDEAHSSQTGESAAAVKRVLGGHDEEDGEAGETTVEDRVVAAIRARGPQANLSFFAFTATPKKRTLELFGTRDAAGEPRAFHLYAMRQAIEEGFILDVLRHYTTYTTYYRLEKAIEDDPEVDAAGARRAIARFMTLHPHNLGQKVEVMVEHFRRHVRHKIGGRAKAMVVTRSRLHAVRTKQAFDRYLKDRDYDGTGVLVAFSGAVHDPEDGREHTEAGMNGFGERELPAKFGTDRYHFLIVAEKYQTGFDQPLLHTMYVDKKLDGIAAVQTLSRLNRTAAGKEDTFVLDFANEAEDIREAFKPFFETTAIDAPTEPNLIYDLKIKLDGFRYYHPDEIGRFAAAFFAPGSGPTPRNDLGRLYALVDPAAARFAEEPEEERQDAFRGLLTAYLRLYATLSQMVTFADPGLEKLYAFGRLLRRRLPARDASARLDLDGDLRLAYYRLAKIAEAGRALEAGDSVPVTGPAEIGTAKPKDEDTSLLSSIVETINERFGAEWREEDRLLFDQVVADLAGDGELTAQARANSVEHFRHVFDPKALDAFIARMDRNTGIAHRVLSDEAVLAEVMGVMMREVYRRANDAPASA